MVGDDGAGDADDDSEELRHPELELHWRWLELLRVWDFDAEENDADVVADVVGDGVVGCISCCVGMVGYCSDDDGVVMD